MPKQSIPTYLRTRLPTLKPPAHTPLQNPITALGQLTCQNWLFFSVAFAAWTWDAFDFFTVSLTVSSLAEEFDRSKKDITWGITLVLMLRSVGAIVFGIAGDRWGRKWPFIVNNMLFIVLELGTGFCQTYKQFLAVRALFGIAMGGIYGNCATTALEDAPPAARGILSGMLQQGYALGYLLAAVFARALAHDETHGWRPLFWFGACPPVLIILGRLALPETNAFRETQRVRRESEEYSGIEHSFVRDAKVGIRRYWLRLIYMVLLMAGFNFMSHGSQDLYPTMLESQLGFSNDQVTITQVVANLGAILGGSLIGYVSQSYGRRLTIITICIVGGALLYPYSYLRDNSIMAAAFFEQFCVQGAWGVIPIHLVELSPPNLRTFVVGTSYQLGNLISSASSTIEATIGERYPLEEKDAEGEQRYDYGKVMAIFMGAVFAYVILLTFLGPEYLGKEMNEGENEAQHVREKERASEDGKAEEKAQERAVV